MHVDVVDLFEGILWVLVEMFQSLMFEFVRVNVDQDREEE